MADISSPEFREEIARLGWNLATGCWPDETQAWEQHLWIGALVPGAASSRELIAKCFEFSDAIQQLLLRRTKGMREALELLPALGEAVAGAYVDRGGEDRLRLADGTILTGEAAKGLHTHCRAIIGAAEIARAALQGDRRE